MSDIFVKTAGSGQTGWRKASNIWVKINGSGQTGWRSALGVWIRNSTQWLKVWPLSGIFATRRPYIKNFASDAYADRMPTTTYPVIRIGTSYFGNNANWDLNGWNASSYQYAWKLYDQYGTDLSLSIRSGTASGWTSAGGTTEYDTLPTSVWTATNSTNADNQYLAFQVTAVNSSNTQYNGVSISTPTIKVIRQKPILASGGNPVLSNNSPAVGDTISYSSSWNTTQAYKPEAGRSSIAWYRSSTVGLTESQLKSLTPIQCCTSYSYIVQPNDVGNYIYAMEEVFNSGTDYEYGIANGVTAIVRTTSLVSGAVGAFTYSIYNGSTVTIPSTPTQTRASSTSNDVLIEFASSTPSDTLDHTLYWSGAGTTSNGNITIGTLNQYTNSSDYSLPIATTANNSPISTYVVANGIYRDIYATLSSTTGASSWGVNFTWSGSQAYGLTYYSNGTGLTSSLTGSTVTTLSNSVDANNRILIARISGSSNPTVTINSVTAYASTGQTGTQKAGTAGTPTSLSAIPRPTATSGTSTSNYTYYSNNQLTGSQRRVLLPSVFNSGTTLYVSTNGYINWGGSDPAGTILISNISSGITLAPLNADLRQGASTSTSDTSIGGLWTFSDSSNFYVTWWGNYYQDGAQVARYQVKFYWGQSYADVIIINNSLTSTTPSTVAVQNGSTVYQNWSGTTAQASTQIAVSSMNRDSTNDGLDDGRTVINAVQPVAPSGGSAYMGNASGSAISSINNGGTIYLWRTNATGSPAPNATWVWQRNDGAGSAYVTRQTGGDTYTTGVFDSGFRIQAVVTWSNGVSPNQVYTTPTTVLVGQAQYTVTWDAVTNGGTGGGTTTQNSGLSHTAPSASKTSYTVSYSSTGQTSGSAPSATQAYFTNTGYYDYIASNPNQTGPIAIGGSFTPSNNITMYMRYGSTSQAVTLPNQGTLLRTGYTFGGWSIGGVTYSAGSSYTPTANVTATAIWTQNLQRPSGGSVTLSGNSTPTSVITASTSGWSNSPTSYDVFITTSTSGTPTATSTRVAQSNGTSSCTYTITSTDAVSPANIFKAFATATNGAGTSIDTAQSSNTITATPAAVQYTVTWQGNGGTPTSTTTGPFNSGTQHNVPSVSRAGHTLNGWYNATSGGSLIVSSGSSTYNPTSNITLYAQWTAVPTNVGNNKPQGAPSISYDSAASTATNWAYDVTVIKSTVGNPAPSYYLQWFGNGNVSNYVIQTGPYTSAGLGGSFVIQNVMVPKNYTLYGCQAWATNGISGQDISNTAMSNTA